MRLTFDNSGQAEDLVDFPVLVTLDATRIDYSQTASQGRDLRFVDADDVTVLSHEVESWNPGGTSHIWVEVPRIGASSSTDFIWLYYGSALGGLMLDPSAVWSNGYVGVWHLTEEEPGTGTAGLYANSARPGDSCDDLTNSTGQDGVVGAGQQFAVGGNDELSCGDIDALDGVSQLTLMVWVHPLSLASYRAPARKGSADPFMWRMTTGQDATSVIVKVANGDALSRGSTSLGVVSTGVWRLWTMVFDGTRSTDAERLRFYSDDNEKTLTFNGAIPATTADISEPFTIGKHEWWDGYVDEVRVANVARSFAWVRAQYRSMTDSFIDPYGPTQSQ